MTRPDPRWMIGRRRFLSLATAGVGLTGIGALGLAGCSSSSGAASGSTDKFDYIKATDPEVAAAEAARSSTGRTATYALVAGLGGVDLGGRLVNTWTYGTGAVAPELRLSAGDTLRASVTNSLPSDTSIHWHGIRVRNDMDGVPPVTQKAIVPGSTFDYSFTAADPGTY